MQNVLVEFICAVALLEGVMGTLFVLGVLSGVKFNIEDAR